MIECGSLEFAQARIQARHGQRTGEALWQRMETTREFPTLLDIARASPLWPWLEGLSARSGSNQIEALMRMQWRKAVAEVAQWMPPPWQAALDWCAVLPDLPVLQYLAQGGAALAWMRDDPDYRPLFDGDPAARDVALGASRFAPLAKAWPDPQQLAQAWQAEWQRRLPTGRADASLHQLAMEVRAHGAAFASAPPGRGDALRRTLQARLALLLRRATLEPAVAFVHLALCALDLERLRGELLRRALFAHAQEA